MSACDCYKKANEALAPYNTRIEMLFRLSGNSLSDSWPISTSQIERGRGKAKAMGLVATFCPLCGVALSKAETSK